MTDTMCDLTLRLQLGSSEWSILAEVLNSQLGVWREYGTAVDWFRSQKARFVPQADQAFKYYDLEFDSQEDLMEFALKWL